MKFWKHKRVREKKKQTVEASTIGGINKLPYGEKRAIYSTIVPPELLLKYQIPENMVDAQGNDLLELHCPPGKTSLEITLYHQSNFQDPILYGHLTDTLIGQVHILFYILNDPLSQRFDIDRLPDGSQTQLGTKSRNIEAELAAMQAGLSPGQIRQGPHLLSAAMVSFEKFIISLEHDLYFAEPLFYHNAIIFERYGYTYQKGRRLMQRIQSGFEPGGDLLPLLDGSTPFRQPQAAHSIRLRSWAIHDGILGHPFQNVTMYKEVGENANVSTCPECPW